MVAIQTKGKTDGDIEGVVGLEVLKSRDPF